LNWRFPNTSPYCIWIAGLEIYNMTVTFRKGKEHTNADAVSRLPTCEQYLLPHRDPKKKRKNKLLSYKEWNLE